MVIRCQVAGQSFAR